jgi:hypothetical protein
MKSSTKSPRCMLTLSSVCTNLNLAIHHPPHNSRLRSFDPRKVSQSGPERDRRQKKGIIIFAILISSSHSFQAKENADDLVAKKKEIDAQAEAKRKQAKEHEVALRVRASTVGNIVGKDVPVSNTEVSQSPVFFSKFSPPRAVP